jgi:hypothetical protein
MPSENRSAAVAIPSVSLPKGGGALTGIRQSLDSVGATGQGGVQIPLPISLGRGFMPSLLLSYASGNGHSAFGMGWNMPLPMIARRSHQGVPAYNDSDQLTGPDGEVLVAVCNEQGEAQVDLVSELLGQPLNASYRVEQFMPRIVGDFSKIERWTAANDNGPAGKTAFWMVRGVDGSINIYGFSELARIADPAAPQQRIARWLLEESLSPTGEHIHYQYRSENDFGLNAGELLRDHQAQRYLDRARYGNRTAHTLPYLLTANMPADWHFELVMDYGEYAATDDATPLYQAQVSNQWPLRQDPHSDYALGFELRTLRLCRQALMFHRFAELGTEPVLVSRLRLNHSESPYLTHLDSVDQFGYAVADKMARLPSLRQEYSGFTANASAESWKKMENMAQICDGSNYQWVDLYGEGIAGILYRSAEGWRYRCAKRASSGGDDVDYGDEQPLPQQPLGLADSPQALLTDMTGDGYLDWVVSQPGGAGFFTAQSDKNWSDFIPYQAFPSEFHHPQAQMAVLGGYLADLSLIGPRSVRLYRNQGGEFAAPIDIAHSGEDLPLQGSAIDELVAFSDVLGSGQQHLIRIRHNQVQCWPNLGHGRFGQPLLLATLPFAPGELHPAQISLADLDGSGAVDIIIAQPDQLLVFRNRCGNGFDTENPLILPLPPGERIDSLSKLTFADLSGQGFASLILTQVHPSPRHYRLDLSPVKPYLLYKQINPLGSETLWFYRSSAQEWLDEKQENPDAVSRLPFPVQLVKRVEIRDKISGNCTTTQYSFRRGWFDGREREFNGFGLVIQRDSESLSLPDRQQGFTAAVINKTWYHTGGPLDRSGFYQDEDCQPVGAMFCTQPAENGDIPLSAALITALAHPLNRALKGSVSRQEVYGEGMSVPYSVSATRPLLRLLQMPVWQDQAIVQPTVLEQHVLTYDGVASDPQATHQVLLAWDARGLPEYQASINAPRRAAPVCPFAEETAQAKWWAHSFDQQQDYWRIEEIRTQYQHREEAGFWRLGLPNQASTATLNFPASLRPATDGISYEFLKTEDGWLAANSAARTETGWQCVVLQPDASGKPHPLGLPLYSESAEFDAEALTAYTGWLEGEALEQALLAAGYRRGATGEPLWLLRSALSEYGDEKQFFRLLRQRASEAHPYSLIEYDKYLLTVVKVTDAAGLVSESDYDYRLLQPTRMTDPQGMVTHNLFDPLGRVIASTYQGKEQGQSTGFGKFADHDFAISTLEEALSKPEQALGDLASVNFYAIDRFELTGKVICSASLSSDRYPGDPLRQIRIAISFSDGFGRILQTKHNVEAGEAYFRDEQGHLALDEQGKPLLAYSNQRWAVSQRVEYNNKGQPVREYQPYFVDGWQYLADEALRAHGYCSCLWYDPLGRPTDVLDANNEWSQVAYHPWYSVALDNNDTQGLARPDWLMSASRR